MKILIVYIIAASLISSCSSTLTKNECETTNWLKKGREDYFSNKKSKVKEYKNQCRDHEVSINEQEYIRGFDSAELFKCLHLEKNVKSPSFEFGKNLSLNGERKSNFSVHSKKCPGLKKEEFENGFKSGLKYFCAKSEKIDEIGWRGIGKRDALNGQPYTYLKSYNKECIRRGIVIPWKEYSKGHKEGLKELCSYEGGQALATKGMENQKTCKNNNEDLFNLGYAIGARFYNAELAKKEFSEAKKLSDEKELLVKKMDGEVASLENQILEGKSSLANDKLKLETEISSLKLELASMQSDFNSIEKDKEKEDEKKELSEKLDKFKKNLEEKKNKIVELEKTTEQRRKENAEKIKELSKNLKQQKSELVQLKRSTSNLEEKYIKLNNIAVEFEEQNRYDPNDEENNYEGDSEEDDE